LLRSSGSVRFSGSQPGQGWPASKRLQPLSHFAYRPKLGLRLDAIWRTEGTRTRRQRFSPGSNPAIEALPGGVTGSRRISSFSWGFCFSGNGSRPVAIMYITAPVAQKVACHSLPADARLHVGARPSLLRSSIPRTSGHLCRRVFAGSSRSKYM
jgi:hypothetical protein